MKLYLIYHKTTDCCGNFPDNIILGIYSDLDIAKKQLEVFKNDKWDDKNYIITEFIINNKIIDSYFSEQEFILGKQIKESTND